MSKIPLEGLVDVIVDLRSTLNNHKSFAPYSENVVLPLIVVERFLSNLETAVVPLALAADAARAQGALQNNLRETFEALCAMRDTINEHIPLPSLESDLLQGPETSVFCSVVAEAVITALQSARAQGAEVKPMGVLCTGCGSSMDDDQLRKKRIENPKVISCCPERHMVPVYATPPAPQPTEADGIEKAAKFIDQQITDYVQEFGSYDPSTGQTEFSEAGQEYLSTLEELAEGIRAIAGDEA